MTDNPHFKAVASWEAARTMLDFEPLAPGINFEHELESLSIHVRDHKMRELSVSERSLEAYFSRFSFTQARKASVDEARRQVVEASYGRAGKEALIAGHVGRVYELGPKPPADDIDGRSPSVVVWHDSELVYLVASDELPSVDLVRIAGALAGAS